MHLDATTRKKEQQNRIYKEKDLKGFFFLTVLGSTRMMILLGFSLLRRWISISRWDFLYYLGLLLGSVDFPTE